MKEKEQWQVKLAEKITLETAQQLEAVVLDNGRGDFSIRGLTNIPEEELIYNLDSDTGQEELLKDLEGYQKYAEENNGVLTIGESLHILKPIVHQKDYENELLYSYGGFGKPAYLGTIGEVLNDVELKEIIDERGIEELKDYVTDNIHDGGHTQKGDVGNDLFINPTKADFQKANVKLYGMAQNENLKDFTRENQVLNIGKELLENQLEHSPETKGQYFVRDNFNALDDSISILKKGEEGRIEHGKIFFDWKRNSFNMDVNNDSIIKQETVQKISNVMKQVNPAAETQQKQQSPKIDLPKLGR